MKTKNTPLFVAFIGVMFAPVLYAQEGSIPKGQDAILTDFGVYGAIGGGVNDFTQPSTAATTSAGGYWDVRFGIGSRTILGAEVGYHGAVHDVVALGLNKSAFLVNNGLEGVARLNVPVTGVGEASTLIEPYAFGGLGWQHYNLSNVTTNTSDVADNDDIMTVPFGAGLALGFKGVTLDGRLTYRQAVYSDLLGSPSSSFDRTTLSNWSAGATLGFEF